MEHITIRPDNVTHIARYLLTLYPQALLIEYQSRWPQYQQQLKTVLSQFLDAKRLTIGETLADHFDRHLSALIICTRLMVEQLAEKTLQELHAALPA